ncbi:tetratricopeptide repeat protein [Aliikangiella coralliicola]|uniref:Tetratricopeptide repeat protein n=1 Tax=Aliikangiella coralliicola TaxID=2592383 RepID=A0A545U001_9GAMM|nr:tetratricopeptide repeat protein [Aliikangiella coralliicola]TQV82792.1 hypothetical protein FLL46_23770 [Aliikangiella coralliicola]
MLPQIGKVLGEKMLGKKVLSGKAFIVLTILCIPHFMIDASAETPAKNNPGSQNELELAIKDFDSGRFQSAEKKFIKILKSNNKHLQSIIYLTRISMRGYKLDDAENYIEQALEISPENAEVQHLSGAVYGSIARDASVFTAMGYVKDCLKGFNKAVELEPGNIDYRLSLINFHLNAPGIAGGDKEIAVEQAKAIRKINEKRGFIALLSVYTSIEDDESTQSLLNSIPQSLANDADVLFNKGIIEQGKEKFERATISFQQAITNAGEKEEFSISKYAAIYQLGRTSVLSQKNIEPGVKFLKRYIAEAPEHESLPSKEWAQFRLANLIEAQGKNDEARVIYQKISGKTQDQNLIKQVKEKL